MDARGDFCDDDDAGHGALDVVVQDNGIAAVICYPAKSFVTFDASTDGHPFVGDITLSGNNAALVGNGADKTVIQGNVIVEKNNAHIRGVHITGNLVLSFNNDTVVLTEVDGNLTSEKNNGLFVSNVVHGRMQLNGNNDKLYFNQVDDH